MSSQSSSLKSCDPKDVRYCYCGLQAPLKTAWTWQNYGRRFFSCPMYQVRRDCQFFQWYDAPMCEHGKRVIKKVKEIQIDCNEKLMKANEDLRKHKKREKVYRLALGICCMVVVFSLLKGE